MTTAISPVTLVFMGDSITEGQYVHHSLRWTEMVAKQVRLDVSRRIDSDSLHFFNRGISGETTRQGLERFPRDVQVLQPDIITIQFGLNDCNCWDSDRGLPRVSEAGYRANLLEMIDRSKTFGAEHIILSTNHPTLRNHPLASKQTLEDRRKIYNEIIREVVNDSKVILCDIDQEFADVSKENLSEMLMPEPDVLHLSEKGHAKYAKAIYTPISRSIEYILNGVER
ncbi:SGNH/GDSL hydrolase family protein [Sedimenticola selenatireducens]|nr:SGNH/GDSL hydrolase family protein [Sedimenticola selenatireducens]